ncbi:MAG: protein kinase, partial [bacterium]|nr:protein kinase [bacterium]
MEKLEGKKISHYKILTKIGEGGMGVVYKAEDTKLKRTVAIKFLPVERLGSKQEKSRFFREAQASAALNHSNIATVYEIDEQDGNSFIVMEYIKGSNLKDVITAGPLKLKKAINIA